MLYEQMLDQGAALHEVAFQIVTCLINLHPSIPEPVRGRIEDIAGRLDANGNNELAGKIRERINEQPQLPRPTPTKRRWKFWGR